MADIKPATAARRLILNSVFRNEFKMMSIDHERVLSLGKTAEYDQTDGNNAVLKIVLDDGCELIMRGFCDGSDFHVDDYIYCQKAG